MPTKRNRKPPPPDKRYIKTWYDALKDPIEFQLDNMKIAVRLRLLLSQARHADKTLYEMSNATGIWPLLRMTSTLDKHKDGTCTLTISKDPLHDMMCAAGIIEAEPPIDADAAWQACAIRLDRFDIADYHRRVETGTLRPQDIFEDLKL